MKQSKLKVLSFVFASLLLVSCDRQEEPAKVVPKEPVKVLPKAPEAPKPASMLTLVPEDTIFFSGSAEPIPLQEVLSWSISRVNRSKITLPNQAQDVEKIKEKATTDGQRLAVALWEDYIAVATATPDTILQSWGIEDTPMLAIYSLGLPPVQQSCC